MVVVMPDILLKTPSSESERVNTTFFNFRNIVQEPCQHLRYAVRNIRAKHGRIQQRERPGQTATFSLLGCRSIMTTLVLTTDLTFFECGLSPTFCSDRLAQAMLSVDPAGASPPPPLSTRPDLPLAVFAAIAAANEDRGDDESPSAVAVAKSLGEETAESPPAAPAADGNDDDAEKKCLEGLAGRPLLDSPAAATAAAAAASAAGYCPRRTRGGENLSAACAIPLFGRLAPFGGCPNHLLSKWQTSNTSTGWTLWLSRGR